MITTELEMRNARPQRRGAAPWSAAPAALVGSYLGRRSRSACACGGGCPKCSEERARAPIGRRATRDGGDAAEALAPPDAAVPAAAPAATPAYRDCSEAISGITDANERLETARQRAREFVGAARGVLGAAPAAGTVYETALGRHFITPTDAGRATIEDTYRQILGTLVVRNYICNSQNICGGEQAFWIPDDDLVHVCRPFWDLSPTCRAIILIHEGAHDIGIGIGAHPPNRGDAEYPAGNVASPAGETTAGRMDNPDAYAFFAAHIWRDTDTGRTCF